MNTIVVPSAALAAVDAAWSATARAKANLAIYATPASRAAALVALAAAATACREAVEALNGERE